ncbi:hypothetical protein [Desulfobacula toluolica]|nr:hypothetical protein [Desulfobacula toluolica]
MEQGGKLFRADPLIKNYLFGIHLEKIDQTITIRKNIFLKKNMIQRVREV